MTANVHAQRFAPGCAFRFVGGLEVRIIPRGWRHPVEGNRYLPLLPAGYSFDKGQGRRPVMPVVHQLRPAETEIAAYETTSEGTPISPAFPNSAGGRLALVRYCADHCATFADHRADAEAWAAILFGDAVVDLEGRVIAEG